MKKITSKSSSVAVFALFFALNCDAASSLFSNYGQIQNVQNYSTNPFWTPNNASYHRSFPRPVYAQGTDLDTAECTNAVQSLIAVQCMARDNCKNTPLSEIRPAIMVQLSSLPNHNYVTACSGYIDGIYEKYVEYYGNNFPKKAAFPSGTTPNKKANNNTNQIENPYKQTTPQWQDEMNARADELAELQRQNGGEDIVLNANRFPATYADLSFSERVENERTGLMPYKDMKPYRELNVKTAEEWCNDSEHKNSRECRAYRDCTDIAKQQDSRVSLAEYDEHHVCKVVSCIPGYQKNKYADGCIENPGTDCLDQIIDEHVTVAEIDTDGKCKVLHCESGWMPNETGTGCDRRPDDDCTDELRDNNGQLPEHVKVAKINNRHICEVTECDDGWRPKEPDKKTCEVEPPKEGDDCLDFAKQTAPEATKAQYKKIPGRDALMCEIQECENGWYVDYQNESSLLHGRCLEETVILRMHKQCTDSTERIVYSESRVGQTGGGDACFIKCDQSWENDRFNTRLRSYGLLGNDVKLCTPSGQPTKGDPTEVVYKSDTTQKFEVGKSKIRKLIEAIDSVNCERGHQSPYYIELLDKRTLEPISGYGKMYIKGTTNSNCVGTW